MNSFNGWINIYKPTNISSFDVIRKIKTKFKSYKMGHAGTLDPLAEGILKHKTKEKISQCVGDTSLGPIERFPDKSAENKCSDCN